MRSRYKWRSMMHPQNETSWFLMLGKSSSISVRDVDIEGIRAKSFIIS